MAQIGIGASGGAHFPGFLKSEKYSSQFQIGPGYGLFIRHDLVKIAKNYQIHARYKVKSFINNIKLPKSGTTRYKFSEFSADIWLDLVSRDQWKWYNGVSINLLNVIGSPKFRSDYTSSQIIPLLLSGFEFKLAESYDFFSEIFLQIAEIDAGPEPLPITGAGILIGFTMYISEPN
jgi:hypothetical protein